jgi:hypothetical protein
MKSHVKHKYILNSKNPESAYYIWEYNELVVIYSKIPVSVNSFSYLCPSRNLIRIEIPIFMFTQLFVNS